MGVQRGCMRQGRLAPYKDETQCHYASGSTGWHPHPGSTGVRTAGQACDRTHSHREGEGDERGTVMKLLEATLLFPLGDGAAEKQNFCVAEPLPS